MLKSYLIIIVLTVIYLVNSQRPFGFDFPRSRDAIHLSSGTSAEEDVGFNSMRPRNNDSNNYTNTRINAIFDRDSKTRNMPRFENGADSNAARINDSSWRNSNSNSRRGNGTGSRGGSGRPNKQNQRICEKKYAEYIARIFPNDADAAADADDSEFDGRELAEPGEYPHMTALGFETPSESVDYKCGGSLISENFVITAAHCTNFTGEKPTKVRIGDLNLMIDEQYLKPQMRKIRRIYNHPQYQSNSYYYDIALLELKESVELTEFVRPIRLWTRSHIPFGTAWAMGYGATSFAKERTNRLTLFNMTIVSNSDCRDEMPEVPESEYGIIESQICARDFIMNRDTCQGDSGGPLQLNIKGRRRRNPKHYHLIGITSYGLFCRSESPSVYTRISSFLDWIESIVW